MRDFSIDIIWAKLQMAITAIGGWLGYFVGGVDGLLTTLIIFMAVDYITGLMCAIADKKLSSAVGFKGICKKVLIILLVGVAHIIDLHVVGTGSALRSAVICFYLSNEGVSLLENTAHLGLPVPDKMKAILSQLLASFVTSSSSRPCSWDRMAFILSGTGRPRWAVFSSRDTPSLDR